MRTGQNAQNWLYSALIGMLGLYESTYWTLVDHITDRFDMGVRLIGALLSIYAAGSFVSGTISGMLADSMGKRRVVLCAGLFMVVGVSTVASAASVPVILLGIFLAGMGHAPCESIGSAILTDENPRSATKWMNISQIFFCVGAVVAPIAAVWYVSLPGRDYRGAIYVCAAALLVCWLLLIFTSKGRLQKPALAKREINPFNVLKNREFLLYTVLVFLYLCYESVAPAYFKQLFLQNGASERMAGMSISIFWLAMILMRFAGIFLGGRELACVRYLTPLVAVGVALLLLGRSDAARIVGVALYGMGCGPVWPMLFVLGSRVFPERSGAAYATMMLFVMAGNSLSPAILGSAVNNVRITFVLCALLAALVTAGGWYAAKKYARRP